MNGTARRSFKLMIVDDSNIMRRRIERSQQFDELELIGTAGNGLEALELFKKADPDVVTMDLTMVNLEAVPDARVGDEVVMFGEQDGESLPLAEVARGSETLPYEVMCTIGKRVTKIYLEGGRPVKLTSLVGESEEWTRRVAEHYEARAEAALARHRG